MSGMMLHAPGWAAEEPSVRASELPPMELEPQQPEDTGAMPLFLATTLNTHDMGLRPALWRDGRVWRRRETLLAMGFRPSALPLHRADTSWIDLHRLTAVEAQFDSEGQSLTLTTPFTALDWEGSRIQIGRTPSPVAQASPGLLLNYDLYGYTTGRSRSLAAATEMRWFSADSVLSNTLFSRYTSSAFGQPDLERGKRLSHTRLDTTFSRSFQSDMLTLRVGDTLTGFLPWTRATRIGGLQIARNFGLQPYRVTSPVPALMGTSALPSDIALYINGMQQYQGRIPAGPFTLLTVPGISGQGTAQVVLTDALGRATTLQYDLYGSTQLLAKGLSDWSAEVGWVRRNYGTKSFDYSADPVASGTWRYGLSDQLTLQSHAEASRHLLSGGAAGVWQAGPLGVLSAAAATSTHASRSGQLVYLAHRWSNERFSMGAQGTRASRHFRDAASLHEPTRQKSAGSITAGYSHASFGHFHAGMIYQRHFGQAPQRYATAGWSRPLGRQGHVSLNVNHNLDNRRLSNVQLLFTWHLSDALHVGSSLTHSSSQRSVSAFASQRAPYEGGWGWDTLAQSGDGGQAQARVNYLGRSFEANASVARANDTTSAALGASGALVWMDGHLFASRQIQDGFAVVSTSGVPNVPIQRDHVPVGMTNRDGVILVPQVSAYHRTRISIDPMSLPAQIRLPEVEKHVSPTDRSGVLVPFELQRIRSALVVLHDSEGKPLPLGSLVTIGAEAVDDKPAPTGPSMVGYDGVTYFEVLASNNVLQVHLPDGSVCEAQVSLPETPVNDIPSIGPIACEGR